MKKSITIFSLGMLMLASCSKNNQESVQQFAEKFQSYAAQNNLDSIKTIWAECILDSVAMPEDASVTVGEPNENGHIRITYAPEVWVDVIVSGNGNVNVLATHGVAAFAPEKYEIAKSTGMIEPELSDIEIAKRMADNDFFAWLSTRGADGYDNALTITPGKKSKAPIPYSEGWTVTCPVTITNNTSMDLSADDYIISYTREYAVCSDYSSPNEFQERTVKGKDLAPGQSFDLVLSDSYCEDIRNPKAKLKMSAEEFAAKNPKTSGNEYAEYLKTKK